MTKAMLYSSIIVLSFIILLVLPSYAQLDVEEEDIQDFSFDSEEPTSPPAPTIEMRQKLAKERAEERKQTKEKIFASRRQHLEELKQRIQPSRQAGNPYSQEKAAIDRAQRRRTILSSILLVLIVVASYMFVTSLRSPSQ